MAHAGSVCWDESGNLRSLRGLLSGARGAGATRFRLTRTRYVLMFVLDSVAAVVALRVAFWLRFDGEIPSSYARVFLVAAPVLLAVRLSCNAFARLHLWSFRLAGFAEALRIAAAALAGTVVFVAAATLLSIHVPRTVYVLELFLSASAFGTVRFLPRAGLRWAASRHVADAPRVIIIGAGHAAELLARDLRRSPDARYRLVGFVEEDAHMARCCIDGIPILGGLGELPDVIRKHRVTTVLLADPRMEAVRIREIVALCATSRVRFKIAPASWAHLERRLSGAMLADMSPEDLLPRATIAFDELEIRRLVEGRRALVTGAGGSIGGDRARPRRP